MRLKVRNIKKPNYILLAFLLPFLAFSLTLLIDALVMRSQTASYVYSLLYSDAYHQYFPFFKAFRSALLSGDSLLYSWNVGMGMDYLGLISYYLGSPLNLLSVLVPENLLVGYFTMLQPLRLGFAGMFFAMFLKKIFRREDFSIVLFSAFYATCAWAFGYMWNTMWVDTFALLPLVILGMVQLLRERKFLLYTVTLFLSIFINYYVGLFTCIFTLLSFICYEISCCKSVKRLLVDGCLMLLFTAIAIGMTAILSLPTLAALETTYSSVNEFPEKFRLNMVSEHNLKGLFEAMRKVATNNLAGLEPNYKASEGLPNIYCGVFANLFGFAFLLNRKIKWRERISILVLLLFINASFAIRQLDYIWHGFHFTNMIPYRFSFLYSFVSLYMAYKAWTLRNKLLPWQALVSAGLTIPLFLFSDGFQDAWETLSKLFQDGKTPGLSELICLDSAFLVINISFILLYSVAMALLCVWKPYAKKSSWKVKRTWYKKLSSRRSIASLVLLCTISAELALNFVFFGVYYGPTNLSHYPRGKADSQRIYAIMDELEKDTLFYRAEVTRTQTLNDGALNGYNGISTFTSSANVSVTKFMKALGYGAMENWNRYIFEESSPVSNLFLNLKYMIERQNKVENNPYFEDIHHSGSVHLLKNNYYLPLGFMTDNSLADLHFAYSTNPFTFQNDLLSAATGEQVTPFIMVDGQELTIQGSDGVTLNNVSDSGTCSYSASKAGSVFYTYTFRDEGLLCLYFNTTKRNEVVVSYNDGGSGYQTVLTHNYSVPYSLSICHVKPGDEVQVTVKCKANESGNLNLKAGIVNQQVMDAAYEKLSRSPLELTTFKNTFVEGTVNCYEDGLLYTSIPQAGENWQVYVDGEPAEVTLVGGAMVGVKLTAGQHTVTFRYHNQAFVIGSIVSALCLLVLAGITGGVCYLKKNPGKFSRKK